MAGGVVIVGLVVGQWYLSLFLQSFFHHRYGAHRQFRLSRRWERVFHLCVYVTQGSSYLDPRAYAILHRMHHAFADTPRDPHSPSNHCNVLTMTWATKRRYEAYAHRIEIPEMSLDGGYPEWELIDRWGSTWTARLAWVAVYFSAYVVFADDPWLYLLLPIQCLMSPIQGAVVNWCGHRYGYRNFETADASRNALPFDFLTLGELFQNNHHRYPARSSFGVRWWEWDVVHLGVRLLAALGVVNFDDALVTRDRRRPNDGPAEHGFGEQALRHLRDGDRA